MGSRLALRPKGSKVRLEQRENTHRHFIKRLCARVAIEESVVLGPESIDTEGRESGLVWGTCHR